MGRERTRCARTKVCDLQRAAGNRRAEPDAGRAHTEHADQQRTARKHGGASGPGSAAHPGCGARRVLGDATRTLEGCTPKCHPEREVKGEAWTPMTADVRDRETSRTGSAAGARLVRTRSCGWNPREGRVSAVGSSRLPSCLSPFPSLLSHSDQGGTRLASVGRPPQGEGPAAAPPLPQRTCTLPRAVPESGPSERAFLGQNSQSALLVSRAVRGQIRSYTDCFLHRCSFGATVAGHEAGTAVVR